MLYAAHKVEVRVVAQGEHTHGKFPERQHLILAPLGVIWAAELFRCGTYRRLRRQTTAVLPNNSRPRASLHVQGYFHQPILAPFHPQMNTAIQH